jgi:pseudouridylate synthase
MHRAVRLASPVVLHPLPPVLELGDEVRSAIAQGLPIVALESTILAHGMPYPQNMHTAIAVEQVVRQYGAIPATVAVIDGKIKVGLNSAEIERIAREGSKCRKVSRRDLASAIADSRGGKLIGATTVSGTMIAAQMAGIEVFVTGGIGGVHRGAEISMDVSADLIELGRTDVAVVCAGVKSILDIPKTLEVLETQGTAIAVLKSEEFPAFFTRKSGCPSPMVVQTEQDCAKMILESKRAGLKSGMVIAVPIPDETDGQEIEKATQLAIQEAEKKHIFGKDVTPFLLKRVNELTKGASLALSRDFLSIQQSLDILF